MNSKAVLAKAKSLFPTKRTRQQELDRIFVSAYCLANR
jgi:hypothetical protein